MSRQIDLWSPLPRYTHTLLHKSSLKIIQKAEGYWSILSYVGLPVLYRKNWGAPGSGWHPYGLVVLYTAYNIEIQEWQDTIKLMALTVRLNQLLLKLSLQIDVACVTLVGLSQGSLPDHFLKPIRF